MNITTLLLMTLPFIGITAAVLVAINSFKKSGSTSTAVRKHFMTVMLTAALCMMVTFVATAEQGTVATNQISDALATALGSAAGMGFIAAALAIGLSAIGAGIALAAGAPAAIGATSENPKAFGKAMIFVVLGEAVALYGFVIAFLILNKIPSFANLIVL